MFFSTLASLCLLVASVAASPTPALAARAATTTVYMRIEGPTKTIFEKTIYPTVQKTLTNNGHTATCNGTPKTKAGVTSLVALQQTGQFFEANWNGKTFGDITKINGTRNSGPNQWGSIFNNAANGGINGGGIVLQGGSDGTNTEYDDFCFQTISSGQHFLFAYFGDLDETNFLTMSGPKTAKVGATVKYEVPYAPEGVYVNDLSVDTTTGQRVHGSVIDVGSATKKASASIKFTKAGTYNMKAHCPSGSTCVRSNHVVTVVS
ncbi:hypothetical protein FIBSPDRAFT_1049051 [Athelia psychrophila]|uniref:Uncharacterized protein n=1 Tax=Athelia psychrophila TaxID=1759441 RepID=A0A166CTQ5_9AGAM|nr:hypothetical protein FIBSPDRAFT_1049051 [Fibularhizoctonia sp. CBS 109695]